MQRLYFVRHGLTEMNVSGHYSGTSETPLTPEGKEQAKQAGQIARDFGIDYIVSSPLSRAHDTAKIIAKEIGYPVKDIHLNSLFIERHFGALEGQAWQPDLDVDGVADIESHHEILSRAAMALEFLHSLPHDNILVVAHGTFGRALRSHVIPEMIFHADPTHPQYGRIQNAEIVQWL